MNEISRRAERVASDSFLIRSGRTLPSLKKDTPQETTLKEAGRALAGSASRLVANDPVQRHPELPSIEEFARIGESEAVQPPAVSDPADQAHIGTVFPDADGATQAARDTLETVLKATGAEAETDPSSLATAADAAPSAISAADHAATNASEQEAADNLSARMDQARDLLGGPATEVASSSADRDIDLLSEALETPAVDLVEGEPDLPMSLQASPGRAEQVDAENRGVDDGSGIDAEQGEVGYADIVSDEDWLTALANETGRDDLIGSEPIEQDAQAADIDPMKALETLGLEPAAPGPADRDPLLSPHADIPAPAFVDSRIEDGDFGKGREGRRTTGGLVVIPGLEKSKVMYFTEEHIEHIDMADVHLVPAGRFHAPVSRPLHGTREMASLQTRRLVSPIDMDRREEAVALLSIAEARHSSAGKVCSSEDYILLHGVSLAERMGRIEDCDEGQNVPGIVGEADLAIPDGSAGRHIFRDPAGRVFEMPSAWAAGWVEAFRSGEPVAVIEQSMDGLAMVIVHPDGSINREYSKIWRSFMTDVLECVRQLAGKGMEGEAGRSTGDWLPSVDVLDRFLNDGFIRIGGHRLLASEAARSLLDTYVTAIRDAVGDACSACPEIGRLLFFDDTGLAGLIDSVMNIRVDGMPAIERMEASPEAIAWAWLETKDRLKP